MVRAEHSESAPASKMEEQKSGSACGVISCKQQTRCFEYEPP